MANHALIDNRKLCDNHNGIFSWSAGLDKFFNLNDKVCIWYKPNMITTSNFQNYVTMFNRSQRFNLSKLRTSAHHL